MAKRGFAFLDCALQHIYVCFMYSSVGVLYNRRGRGEQDHEGIQAAYICTLRNDTPPKDSHQGTLSLSAVSAYHYFAMKALTFLLSLAARAVSGTGSVATAHRVCLVGRMKPSPIS